MEHPPILLGRFSLALVSETSTQYGRTPRPAAILALFLSIGEKSGYHSLKNLSWSDWRVAQGLIVGDALFDPRDELRRVPLHYFPDTGLKLVEDVDARVAANGRCESFERRRSGARPIWAVSGDDRGRRQHPKEIRRVQCRLSGIVPRDYRA